MQSICRQQNKCYEKLKYALGRVENVGNKEKMLVACWLPAFSNFPTFSKDFFLKVVKSWDCVVKK